MIRPIISSFIASAPCEPPIARMTLLQCFILKSFFALSLSICVITFLRMGFPAGNSFSLTSRLKYSADTSKVVKILAAIFEKRMVTFPGTVFCSQRNTGTPLMRAAISAGADT